MVSLGSVADLLPWWQSAHASSMRLVIVAYRRGPKEEDD